MSYLKLPVCIFIFILGSLLAALGYKTTIPAIRLMCLVGMITLIIFMVTIIFDKEN